MKDLTTFYTSKNILFKQINEVLPKQLGSRKKIGIYTATDIKSTYYAIFIVDAKSRFIRKNANDLLELFEKLKEFKGHNFKHKELLISSPLCSKAKSFLKDNEWRVRVDFM
ncbi:hypothetical protein CP960_05370 [Malaciobacter halophilus]|uniref:Uncharacterized protein n=1 Tax=Malaciobacter halophilus TaxID=197482 RepID=A0A2N1J3Q7_9BACT|nr:hypothetical protein [Malaciobacter halophilus]AXH08764.1 hypothetical protein AHALO_0363 [Malaciobacter halophilus]PKI81176.1 hypothetical protein CP960_05370 [Malaciobacter halophilus]